MGPLEIPGESQKKEYPPCEITCPYDDCGKQFDRQDITRSNGSIDYRCPYCGRVLDRQIIDNC